MSYDEGKLISTFVSFYVLVYEQYRSIEPWLQTKEGKAEGQAEFLQTREDRAKLDGMVSLCCYQFDLDVVCIKANSNYFDLHI